MPITLTYSNEDDRAYGLAGMTISLADLNALDRIARISLDTEGPMVDFSYEYYFSTSPAVSPKVVWDNLLQNYHLTASMVISNVLARSMARLGEEAPAELMKTLYDEIETEGRETVGLEPDEVKMIYNRLLSRNRRLFTNPRLRTALAELAGVISRRRTLSGGELRDELNYLQL